MKVFLFLSLFFPVVLICQSKVDFGIRETGVLKDDFDLETTREYIYQSALKEFKEEITDRALMRFSNESVQSLVQIFNSGLVYTDWEEANSYVNEVLGKLKASSGLTENENIKVYLRKDAYPNAFMTPSGYLFVNIGLLSELDSESSLAGIISHELAHYKLNHGIEGFVKDVQGDFKPGIFFNYSKAASKYSIGNELDADELASEYLINAGYNYDGLIEAFEVFKKVERKIVLKDPYLTKLEEITHPRSERRIQLILDRKEQALKKKEAGKHYLVGEKRFVEIKEKSKAEVLSILLSTFEYQECLERSFRFHIYDPNNTTYIYYVMESIRRKCYLNVDEWSEKFIVNRYYQSDEEATGIWSKEKIKTGFFDEFRYDLLYLDQEDFDDIEAKFYWEEEKKFDTYEEAYQFFFEIGKLLEEPECYLSNALSLFFEKEKRNKWLEKYLTFQNVRHAQFAEKLLVDSITDYLSDKKLVAFSNFVGVIKQSPDYVVLFNDQSDTELRDEMGSIVGEQDSCKYLYLKDLYAIELKDYIEMTNLERFSMSLLVSKGYKPELYILDPNYWRLFSDFEVNEIQFVNCLFEDKVKGKYTKEVYLGVADSKLNSLLEKSDAKGRTLSLFLTSVAMKDDEPMKKRYVESNIKLKQDESGYHQTIQQIVSVMHKINNEK